MSGLPAQFLGLKDRGLIKEGFAADLVVFDLRNARRQAVVRGGQPFSPSTP